MQALGIASDNRAVAAQLEVVRARLERAEWLPGIRSWYATRCVEPDVVELHAALGTDAGAVGDDVPAGARPDDVHASQLRLRRAGGAAERDEEHADPPVTDAAQ
ncbi:MAG TPA: hypothetical protein VIL20_19255 [Sandaracinaceae bacterium]